MMFNWICQKSIDLHPLFLTKIQLSKEFGRAFYTVNYRWWWLSWKQTIKTLARFPFRREVYDAILRNKLLCGLETVHLTQTQQKNVNALQLRGLRKILGLSTTFVNRSNANEHVSQKAHEEIGHTPGTPSKIKLFSALLKNDEWSLLHTFCDRTTVTPWGELVMNVILRSTTMLGKEEWGSEAPVATVY